MNVLAILPGLIPSTIIGIVKPLERLADKGEINLRVKTTWRAKLKDIHEADVVVFCRNTDYKDLTFLYEAKRAGKYVVYDIDDNFFAIPTHSGLGMMHRWSPRLFIVNEFFRLSDTVRTYAQPMYDEAVKHNDNVLLVKSYFDFSLIDHLQTPPRSADEAVRICYQTSRGPHDTMMNLFIEPLNQVIFENPGKIEFHFWGKEYPPVTNRGAVRLHPFDKNYNRFVADAYRSRFDIGLAPIGTDLFSRSKTNNKYREYGAMGVAGIYTRMSVYEDCVEDGVNGLLVDNTEPAWRDAIERLVRDPDLRRRIADNAQADVRARYSIESTVDGWRDILGALKSPRYGVVPPEPQEERMNVLAFQDGAGLDAWTAPIREVCGFMGADLVVHALDNFGELHARPLDVAIVVSPSFATLADAAWRIQHKPKRLFLVLAAGARQDTDDDEDAAEDAAVPSKTRRKPKTRVADAMPASETTPVLVSAPPARRRLKAAERRARTTLEEICAMLGHVTIVANDPLAVEGMTTKVNLIEDPSPMKDVQGGGLARFWIEQLSRVAIARRDRRWELRINHRLSGLNERLALYRINNRRRFRR